MIDDLIDLFALKCQSKGLEFQVEAPSEIPILMGDTARIRQVASNLVGNAVKFTERGYVKISLKVEDMGSDLKTLILAVQDTGIGTSPSQPLQLSHCHDWYR